MTRIDILIGTMTGASEYVAEAIADSLADRFRIRLHPQPELTGLPQQGLWLICTATHGAGELPDNIRPFYDQLQSEQPDLHQLRFGLVALGDSSYDTFCRGGDLMEHALRQCQATLLPPRLNIDAQNPELPEDQALKWLPQWLSGI